MKIINNKKGQVLENLGAIAIGIATFTIIIVITFLMMVQTKEAGFGFLDSASFINSTTAVTAGSASLVNGNCIDEQALGVTQVFNTSGAEIVADNYTVTTNHINIAVTVRPGATVNITYSCKIRDAAYNSTEKLQEATDDIPGWIPLIVIVMIGGIILFMVQGFRQ